MMFNVDVVFLADRT